MTPEERIAKLEAEMDYIKKALSEVKENHSEVLGRLNKLELKIAFYTGSAVAAVTLIEYLLRKF
jgi:phage shock protein A